MIRITDIHEIIPVSQPSIEQRYAVAKLLGMCDAVVGFGTLPPETEQMMRELIVETSNAFGMPTKAERTVRVGDHAPEPVR